MSDEKLTSTRFDVSLLAHSEHAMMREALDHMDQGVVLYELDGEGREVVGFFNAKAEGNLELPAGTLRLGLLRSDIVRHCVERGDHGEDFDYQAHIAHAANGVAVEVIGRRPSGRYVLNRSLPRDNTKGSLTLYIDVTDSIVSGRRLHESRAEYKAMTETAPIGFLRIDRRGRTRFANPAALKIFGTDPHMINVFRQLLPAGGKSFEDVMETQDEFEASLELSGGRRHIFVTLSPWSETSEEPERLIALTDVTALRTARMQVEHLAHHDSLTGLGNRALFNACWTMLEESAGGYMETGTLIALDLDHFKLVNDEHGHAMGDRLLRAVAARIESECGPAERAFRLGGDEFAVVMGLSTRRQAVVLAERLVDVLSDPFTFGDVSVTIGCSAGVASMPRDGRTLEQVQRAADVALYQVKRTGRNAVACFDPELERVITERRRLDSDLAVAASSGDFSLVFQPQIDLKSGRTTGLEALIRWHNRRLDEQIAPSRFVPMAESAGLIQIIDFWVIRNAIAAMRRFLDAGFDVPCLSINLSPITLGTLQVVEHLTTALKEHGVAPGSLEIEITEGVAIGNVPGICETLKAIQAVGMRVAIDDFGAGHASLAYIRSLPIDRVKIDRSIIGGLGRDGSTEAIISAVRDLCDSLGLKVTAEGIETAGQADMLRRLGDIEGQGFYLGHPEPAEALLAQLRRSTR